MDENVPLVVPEVNPEEIYLNKGIIANPNCSTIQAVVALKPLDETILEHTIGYEQLAVDLTAIMAQNETDAYVKAALDFALLEDFDHLYRQCKQKQ